MLKVGSLKWTRSFLPRFKMTTEHTGHHMANRPIHSFVHRPWIAIIILIFKKKKEIWNKHSHNIAQFVEETKWLVVCLERQIMNINSAWLFFLSFGDGRVKTKQYVKAFLYAACEQRYCPWKFTLLEFTIFLNFINQYEKILSCCTAHACMGMMFESIMKSFLHLLFKWYMAYIPV